MTDWGLFVGIAVLVLILVVVFSTATSRLAQTDDTGEAPPIGATDQEPTYGPSAAEPDVKDDPEAEPADDGAGETPGDTKQSGIDGLPELSDWEVFLNVLGTHGLFTLVLAGAVWYTAVPLQALGVGDPTIGPGTGIIIGVGLGGVLYLANALIAANLDVVGIEYSEALRETLAPDGSVGWVLLLGGVLPIVALFEELLFRAALIGAIVTGYGVSPWLLVVLTSVAFALGHGIQGPGGILVTGLLGAVLAVAFVLTWSLLLVIVAHYVINALEFGISEGLDIDTKELFAIDQ